MSNGLSRDRLNRLFRFAFSLTKVEEKAFDLVQSSFERVLKRNMSAADLPDAYFFTVIRRLHIDEYRYTSRRDEVPYEDSETVPTVQSIEDKDFSDIILSRGLVASFLETLRDDERELLFLHAVEDHTVSEIAEMTQVPKGTLLARLHRIRKKAKVFQQSSEEGGRHGS